MSSARLMKDSIIRFMKFLLLATLAISLPANPVAAQSTSNPPTVRVIVLRPWGFEPSQVAATAGSILFVVYNRSGLRQAAFRLDAPGGTVVRQVTLPLEKRAWREIISVPAGTYVLREVNRGWTCRIVISPRQ